MFHVAHGSTNDNRNVKQKHKHSNGIHENSEKDGSHPTVSLLENSEEDEEYHPTYRQ